MKYIKVFILSVFVFALVGREVQAEKKLLVRGACKAITLTGYTRCSKSVMLSSEISGKAVKVNYSIGDVTGENPFVEIDPTFIRHQVKAKKIQIKQFENQIEKLKSRITLLKKQQKRMQSLRNDEYVSAVKYDGAIQELTASELEHKILLCDKEMMKVELNRLEDELKRYDVHCFQGGIVTSCLLDSGEFIQAGVPFAEISDFNTLVVPFSVSEGELKALQSLPEKFDASVSGLPVLASINYINPRFNEQSRKHDVELKIIGQGFPKRGGLNFSTQIMVDTDGLLVPRDAIENRYGNPRVKLKETSEHVSVLILGESGEDLIVTENDALPPGTELVNMTVEEVNDSGSQMN